jgi:hypothetical protein
VGDDRRAAGGALLIIMKTVLDAAGKPDIAGFLFEEGTLTGPITRSMARSSGPRRSLIPSPAFRGRGGPRPKAWEARVFSKSGVQTLILPFHGPSLSREKRERGFPQPALETADKALTLA